MRIYGINLYISGRLSSFLSFLRPKVLYPIIFGWFLLKRSKIGGFKTLYPSYEGDTKTSVIHIVEIPTTVNSPFHFSKVLFENVYEIDLFYIEMSS